MGKGKKRKERKRRKGGREAERKPKTLIVNNFSKSGKKDTQNR
jgi:hypothetical protein